MDKGAIFPPSGICHLQQFYHSPLYWFALVTPRIQTDIGVEPNTRDDEDASNSDPKKQQAPPNRELK
jgi:hypothetical protein